MNTEIEYQKIAPLPTDLYGFVSSFWTRTSPVTGEPIQMVLNLAIDPLSTGGLCEMPVYIPAENNYKDTEHMKMLDNFRRGDPFCAIQLEAFHVYCKTVDGKAPTYYGTAESFTVPSLDTVRFNCSDML